MNNNSLICPYCHSTIGCEHTLLLVDATFRTAESGFLMGEFNHKWSAICEEGGDNLDERGHFEKLLKCVDSLATAIQEYDHEDTPGQSTNFIAYFLAPEKDVSSIIKKFRDSTSKISDTFLNSNDLQYDKSTEQTVNQRQLDRLVQEAMSLYESVKPDSAYKSHIAGMAHLHRKSKFRERVISYITTNHDLPPNDEIKSWIECTG